MSWQRDLSVRYDKIGYVKIAQGDLPGALEAFNKCLEIRERLAAQDVGNMVWQRDIIISHVKLAEIGQTPRQHYEKALIIAKQMYASGRMQPVDQRMVPELEKRLEDL